MAVVIVAWFLVVIALLVMFVAVLALVTGVRGSMLGRGGRRFTFRTRWGRVIYLLFYGLIALVMLGLAGNIAVSQLSKHTLSRMCVIQGGQREVGTHGGAYWMIDTTCGTLRWDPATPPAVTVGGTYRLTYVASRNLFGANTSVLENFASP